MFVDAMSDRGFITPDDDGVKKSVAAIVSQVVVGVAEPAEVVGVIGQGEVTAEMPPANLMGSAPVRFEDYCLLRNENLAGSENLASAGGVFRGDEICVGTAGLFCGQLKHLRTECCKEADH